MITIDDVIELIQNGYKPYVESVIKKCEEDNSDTIAFFYAGKNLPVSYRGLFCESTKRLEIHTSEYVSMPVTTVKTLLLLIN